MCYWGGPTGINSDTSADPVTIEWYGNGEGMGHEWYTGATLVPARSAVALGLANPDTVTAFGPANQGDSGSAVISSDGRAIGDLIQIGNSGSATPSNDGDIFISRLGPDLKRAQKFMGIRFRLVTAPLA